MPRLLYHITLPSEWAEAISTGRYRASTRGRTLADEGFVHLSYRHQVTDTANRYYGDIDELCLLVVDPDPLRLGAEIRVEGGFPHLYGPLLVGAVVEAIPWRRGPREFVLPDGVP